MFRHYPSLVTAFISSFAAPAVAQTTPISITNGTYFQDFNSMGSGTTYPSGWNGYRVGTTTFQTLIASDGSSATGSTYNYGTTGNGDRALGSVGSGTTVPGFGAVFINNSGRVLTETDVLVSFRAEQWRIGTSTDVESWIFEYRVDDIPIDVNQSDSLNYNQVSGFNLIEIRNDLTTSGPLNGNANGNFVNVSSSALTNLIWNPGDRLVIRWLDANDPGNDSGMSIDDFSFIVVDPVPEPATLSMCGIGLLGLACVRRRRRSA